MKPQPVPYAVSDQEMLSLWEKRHSIEDFLREMRSRGARQVESIKAICLLDKLPLVEAKKIVHFSRTWSDTRAASEDLHDEFYRALEEISHEEEAVTSKQLAS